ncbi:hypothetical protein CesoFtcFv8_025660 [Champsocephalus esox]|uniref:Uncharacterized protein n=1 Tax=Champsocephalus esox TaxID=159716 RepID=A0AAN8G9K0_9TELE|nr:hypothetical protein CesoFtcFv8_025660 [Champsocephalus esox]
MSNALCGMSKTLLGNVNRQNLGRGPFGSVTLSCTAGFDCMVMGNVLSGDSYPSCLSQSRTLIVCGDGCLIFSGDVCCRLRGQIGHWPDTRKTAW